MSRFNQKFRQKMPGRVANHFDKYIQFINPVPFNPFEEIYKPAWPKAEWDACNLMLDSKFARPYINKGTTFKVYVSDDSNKSEWQRDYVQFHMPAGVKYPSCNIELLECPQEVIDKVRPWMSKGLALRKLRSELYKRIEQLLDWGWDCHKHWDSYNGGWRGGPTTGQGCNTMGQVNRIWPELVVYFPPDEIAKVRNANQKSRLPAFIKGHGTPGMFTCEERPHHIIRYLEDETDDGKRIYGCEMEDPYTDEQWEFAKRKFDALNHILIQMSLVKDVPHVRDYPDIHVGK